MSGYLVNILMFAARIFVSLESMKEKTVGSQCTTCGKLRLSLRVEAEMDNDGSYGEMYWDDY